MSFDPATLELARDLLAACRAAGLTLGTVESCTGGLVSGALTAIPGSSDVVMAGLVTYSNAAKTELAGVPAELVARHGAVSVEVARAMAEGGRSRLGVDVCLAVTGIAGPGGGTKAKPVGLVHFAVARAGTEGRSREVRLGPLPRVEIRDRSVAIALRLLAETVQARP